MIGGAEEGKTASTTFATTATATTTTTAHVAATMKLKDRTSSTDCNSSSCVDWNLSNSIEVQWDDGHTPETFAIGTDTVLRKYPDFHHDEPSNVGVHSMILPETESLATSIYNYTTSFKNGPTWGNYVTIDELAKLNATDAAAFDPTNENDLALHAAAIFLKGFDLSNENTSHRGNTNKDENAHSNGNRNNKWKGPDSVDKPHGIAVWALASGIGSEVPYHLDYAELLRYETNVIVPPVLAGTWHCTKTSGMCGGEYRVSTNGLQHYKQHGYKGMLQSINSSIETATSSCGSYSSSSTEEWIRIPYTFNQLIIQSGHLPHCSTRVNDIQSKGSFRVIVGFNMFLNDVGPSIAMAPEHSLAFKQRVQAIRRKLQQQRKENSNKNSHISLDKIKSNPKIRNLLVLAKREKIKEEYLKTKQQINILVDEYMQQKQRNSEEDGTIHDIILYVAHVMRINSPTANYRSNKCASIDYDSTTSSNNATATTTASSVATKWPNTTNDIRVHLHHRLLNQKDRRKFDSTTKSTKNYSDSIGTSLLFYRIDNKENCDPTDFELDGLIRTNCKISM